MSPLRRLNFDVLDFGGEGNLCTSPIIHPHILLKLHVKNFNKFSFLIKFSVRDLRLTPSKKHGQLDA